MFSLGVFIFLWDNESFMDGKRARSDIMRQNTKTVK